jgi:dynein heavy chain
MIVHAQLRSYLDAPSLLKLEPEESIVKVNNALKTIDTCIAHYHTTRTLINTEAAKPAAEGNPSVAEWSFDDDLVFWRLTSYRERIVLVQQYINTVVDFLKLEKVETGIERYNTQIKAMLEQFTSKRDEIGKLSEEKYDCLDPTNPGFLQSLESLKELSVDFDRRLTTMALASFEEVGSLEASAKLIIAFQGLLDRPTIAEAFDAKYSDLIRAFDAELDTLKTIFDEQKIAVVIAKNMPRTAGVLLVCVLAYTDAVFRVRVTFRLRMRVFVNQRFSSCVSFCLLYSYVTKCTFLTVFDWLVVFVVF